MNITNKGTLYSADFMFSFTVFTAILFLSLLVLWNNAAMHAEKQERKELELHAIYLADTLVKNHDENSGKGIAAINVEKKRVLSNKIDAEKIIELGRDSEIFSAWLKDSKGNKKIFFQKYPEKRKCIAVERMVIVGEEEMLFGVKTCE